MHRCFPGNTFNEPAGNFGRYHQACKRSRKCIGRGDKTNYMEDQNNQGKYNEFLIIGLWIVSRAGKAESVSGALAFIPVFTRLQTYTGKNQPSVRLAAFIARLRRRASENLNLFDGIPYKTKASSNQIPISAAANVVR